MNARSPVLVTEADILQALPVLTYDEIRAASGWSRGKIYNLALKHNARKTEARIRERVTERKARQLESLAALIDTTAKADVLDYLDSLPDGAARLILSSIPYNVGKRYGDGASADQMAFVYFMGWTMQVISECARILKDGGTLFLQVGSTRDETGGLAPLDALLFEPLKKTGLTFQSRVIWTQPHGLTPRGRLAERHETALVFSKGPSPVFNPTPARKPQKGPGKRAFKGKHKGKLSSHPLGAWPSNVWDDIGNVGHNHPERTGHPAQFPLELARRAVLVYSMPGDLIIDPFSGSGTTHVACRETGRSFSGCDLFYEDLRAKRLASVEPDLVSHLPGVSDETLAVWQAEARRVDAPAQTNLLDFLP
ncbi:MULTISPECIES: DNA-methyltransferase [Microvirga]|uniref:DNA-methyltransferase n=1 Tax=Microvirga TaxID=186650 RepID=UPI0021C6035B|nr:MULTISPECIES: site-specific DNA-methyltransferase [unclassified Microvirga]